MIAGQFYRAADAELVAARIHARWVVRAHNATDPAAEDERSALPAGPFGPGVVAAGDPCRVLRHLSTSTWLACVAVSPLVDGDGASRASPLLTRGDRPTGGPRRPTRR